MLCLRNFRRKPQDPFCYKISTPEPAEGIVFRRGSCPLHLSFALLAEDTHPLADEAPMETTPTQGRVFGDVTAVRLLEGKPRVP